VVSAGADQDVDCVARATLNRELEFGEQSSSAWKDCFLMELPIPLFTRRCLQREGCGL
jgi:hypothetical protein